MNEMYPHLTWTGKYKLREQENEMVVINLRQMAAIRYEIPRQNKHIVKHNNHLYISIYKVLKIPTKIALKFL